MLQVKQNELYSLKRHKDNQLKFISGSLKKLCTKKTSTKIKLHNINTIANMAIGNMVNSVNASMSC